MKILVTSKSFGKIDQSAIQLLKDHGFTISWLQDTKITSELIASHIQDVDCLIVGNDPVGKEVFEKGNRLKLVHMHGTGLDGIDVPSATDHHVLVANVIGANKNAVAEMTLALMLTVGRRIDRHIQWFRSGTWKRVPGNEVSYKTIGIIGLGNIGKRLVELLEGFHVHVLGYDPYVDHSWAQDNHVELSSHSDDVFSRADFVVLALPLTAETENIVCTRTLGLMKSTSYLINTARGGLVDEEALSDAIMKGAIAGAALDAYRQEPPHPSNRLFDVDIVMTPHISATSVETSSSVSHIVAQQVIDILCEGHRDIAVNATHKRASGDF